MTSPALTRYTRTPVIVGAAAMSLNVIFSLAFSAWFTRLGIPAHGGLALANSLATGLEAVLLLKLMGDRLHGLDGRLVPGGTQEDMLRELHHLLGPDLEIAVTKADPGPAAPNMGLFDTLGDILKELDPSGIPLPYVMSGVTDARFLSKLGIQTYGFTPMQLPEDFNFASTVHAADERVPMTALDFGLNAIYQALQNFK